MAIIRIAKTFRKLGLFNSTFNSSNMVILQLLFVVFEMFMLIQLHSKECFKLSSYESPESEFADESTS